MSITKEQQLQLVASRIRKLHGGVYHPLGFDTDVALQDLIDIFADLMDALTDKEPPQSAWRSDDA